MAAAAAVQRQENRNPMKDKSFLLPRERGGGACHRVAST
jgi:hypothetical protein